MTDFSKVNAQAFAAEIVAHNKTQEEYERQRGQVRGVILRAVEEQGITAHERTTLALIADILHISLESS